MRPSQKLLPSLEAAILPVSVDEDPLVSIKDREVSEVAGLSAALVGEERVFKEMLLLLFEHGVDAIEENDSPEPAVDA